MKTKLLSLLLAMSSCCGVHAAVTIEECVSKAMENYPLIRKYGLLETTTDIELSDINKGWLPRIGLYGQASGQNIVPSFPDALSGVLQQMGQEVKGIDRFQYKAGIDFSQTIWDGGASRAGREHVRAQESVKQVSLDVEMYAVRQRVENVYFAILLTEEQIAQNHITYDLLTANLEKMRAMLKNGTAMQSDVDMVEAQALALKQVIRQAQFTAEGYRRVLGIFIGEDVISEVLIMPDSTMPLSDNSNRPELKLFDKQVAANNAADKMANVSLMPRIGLFAQAYYGYPGLDYFKSMMERNLSFNILAGVKVSWNIDSFYTRKNTRRRTSVNNAGIATDKDLFLFNNRLQATSQMVSINGMQSIIMDDARIVELRKNVRKAAESQLDNGVIDATALLTKITDENVARLTSRYHDIQLRQEIYKLKYILNQ